METLNVELISNQSIGHDFLFKGIIIGPSNGGKSCILLRATKNAFREIHEVTIGVDFGFIIIKIDDKIIKLQIWDTSGQEQYKSVSKVFYKNTDCVFLVFDITSKDSFHNISSWLEEIRSLLNPSPIILLVGNKLDEESKRNVSKVEAEEYVVKNKLNGYYETSAKTGENINELLKNVSKLIFCSNIKIKKEEEKVKLKTENPEKNSTKIPKEASNSSCSC